MPPRRNPDLLTRERLRLLEELGVTTTKSVGKWNGSSDPLAIVQTRRSLSRTSQTTYAVNLSKPIKVKKKVIPTGAGKNALELALLPHEGEPGPSQYDTRPKSDARGGTFSKGVVPTELEILEHKAAQEPGPGDLLISINNRGMPLQSTKVPKWSDCPRASELDEITKVASQSPGPGAFGIPEGWPRHFATKFNEAVVPSALDSCILRANDTPAPHDYGHIDAVQSQGGQFSTAFPPTALEELLRSKRNVPGPASYDPPCPKNNMVGKFSEADVPSDVDKLILRAQQSPGPGTYSIFPKHQHNSCHPYPTATGFPTTPGVEIWPQLTTRPNPQREKKNKQIRNEVSFEANISASYSDDEFESPKQPGNETSR